MGYWNPIKKYPAEDVIDQLSKIVVVIAEKYGNRTKLNDSNIAMIVDDIMKNFPHYGINEIEIAFNLWSLGKIDGIEMYGEINALVFNRILSGYEKIRRQIVNEHYSNQVFEQKDPEREAWLKKIDLMKDNEIRGIVEEYDNWDDIPYWVVLQVSKRKMIRMDKETQEIYRKRAKEIVKNEDEGMYDKEFREQIVYAKLITFENL